MRNWALVVGLLTGMAGNVFAMESESLRVAVWRKGESIYGEEFVAANEAVVDYLSTLKRPTGMFDVIKYRCNVKSRTIRPSVTGGTTGTGITQYVWVRTVYDLKDCVQE
jgi:hypothetical protein